MRDALVVVLLAGLALLLLGAGVVLLWSLLVLLFKAVLWLLGVGLLLALVGAGLWATGRGVRWLWRRLMVLPELRESFAVTLSRERTLSLEELYRLRDWARAHTGAFDNDIPELLAQSCTSAAVVVELVAGDAWCEARHRAAAVHQLVVTLTGLQQRAWPDEAIGGVMRTKVKTTADALMPHLKELQQLLQEDSRRRETEAALTRERVQVERTKADVDLQRATAEAEQTKGAAALAEVERLKEEVRVQELRVAQAELERQNKLQQWGLELHCARLYQMLAEQTAESLRGEPEALLFDLYLALKELMGKLHRDVPEPELMLISNNARRVKQLAAMVRLYGQQIKQAREEGDTDAETLWRDLRDTLVAQAQGR